MLSGVPQLSESSGVWKAYTPASSLMLKPQFLDTLSPVEREAWIAVELVSEMGIFGWSLFGGEAGAVREKETEWLVRTKGQGAIGNGGDTAAEFSVMDSISLTDNWRSHT